VFLGLRPEGVARTMPLFRTDMASSPLERFAAHEPAAALAPTPMQKLREATRVAHASIEASLPLFAPTFTRAHYVRLVEAFYGFYAPLELRIADAALLHSARGAHLAIRGRAKAPLLVDDLLALGKTSAQIEALPRCTALPRVASASRVLGALYVLEGATLGGQIISRHLRDRLDLEKSSGAAFFVGYGEATGVMWKRFAAQVDGYASLDIDAAIGAAIETFETLERWLIASLDRS
jgi:heme oxygenase